MHTHDGHGSAACRQQQHPQQRGDASDGVCARDTTTMPAVTTTALPVSTTQGTTQSTLPSSLDVLRRTARLTSAAVDVNADTTRQLCVQGEQLDGMDYTLDDTDYTLKRSNRLVRGMTSWGGMFKNCFTSRPQPPPPPPRHAARSSSSLASQAQHTSHTAAPSSPASASASGDGARDGAATACTTITTTASTTTTTAPRMSSAYAARVAAEDKLVDTIHADVLQLREQALVQQSLLTQQCSQLDRIHDKTDTVQQRLDKVSRRVREALYDDVVDDCSGSSCMRSCRCRVACVAHAVRAGVIASRVVRLSSTAATTSSPPRGATHGATTHAAAALSAWPRADHRNTAHRSARDGRPRRPRRQRARGGGGVPAAATQRDVTGMVVPEALLRARRIRYDAFDEQLAVAAHDVLGSDVVDVHTRAAATTTTTRAEMANERVARSCGAHFDVGRIRVTAQQDGFAALARQAAAAAAAAARQRSDTTATTPTTATAHDDVHESDAATMTTAWPLHSMAYVRDAAAATTATARTHGARDDDAHDRVDTTHALVRRALGRHAAVTSVDKTTTTTRAHSQPPQDGDDTTHKSGTAAACAATSSVTRGTDSFAAALLSGKRTLPHMQASSSSTAAADTASRPQRDVYVGDVAPHREAAQRRVRHARWLRAAAKATSYYGEWQHPCRLQCAGCFAARARTATRRGATTSAPAADEHDDDDGGVASADCAYRTQPALRCLAQLRTGVCARALLGCCPWHHSTHADTTTPDHVREVCAEVLIASPSHDNHDDDDSSNGHAMVRRRLRRSVGAVCAIVQLFADLVTDMLERDAALRVAFCAASPHDHRRHCLHDDNDGDDDDDACTRRQCALLRDAATSSLPSSSSLLFVRVPSTRSRTRPHEHNDDNDACHVQHTTTTTTYSSSARAVDAPSSTLLLATQLSFALCAAQEHTDDNDNDNDEHDGSDADSAAAASSSLLRDLQHLWSGYVSVLRDRADVTPCTTAAAAAQAQCVEPLLCVSPLLTRVVLDLAHEQLQQQEQEEDANALPGTRNDDDDAACARRNDGVFVRCAQAVLRRRVRDCERVVSLSSSSSSPRRDHTDTHNDTYNEVDDNDDKTRRNAATDDDDDDSDTQLWRLRWAPVLLLRDCVLLQHIDVAVAMHDGDGGSCDDDDVVVAAALRSDANGKDNGDDDDGNDAHGRATMTTSHRPALLLLRLLEQLHTGNSGDDNRNDDAHAATAAAASLLHVRVHTAWCAVHHTLTLILAALQQLHVRLCASARLTHHDGRVTHAPRRARVVAATTTTTRAVTSSMIALHSLMQPALLGVAQSCSDAMSVQYEHAWRDVTGADASRTRHAAVQNTRYNSNSSNSCTNNCTHEHGATFAAAAAAAAYARQQLPLLSASCMHSLLNAFLLQCGCCAEWLQRHDDNDDDGSAAAAAAVVSCTSSCSSCAAPTHGLYADAIDGSLVQTLLLSPARAHASVCSHHRNNDDKKHAPATMTHEGCVHIAAPRAAATRAVATALMRAAQQRLLRISMMYVAALHEHGRRLRARDAQLQLTYSTRLRRGRHGNDDEEEEKYNGDDTRSASRQTRQASSSRYDAAVSKHGDDDSSSRHGHRHLSTNAHAAQRAHTRAVQQQLAALHALPLLDRVLPVGSTCVSADATATLLRQLRYSGKAFKALQLATSIVHTCRLLRHAAAQPLPRLVQREVLMRRRVWSAKTQRKQLVTMRVPLLQLVYDTHDKRRSNSNNNNNSNNSSRPWREDVHTRYLNELRNVQRRYGHAGDRSTNGDEDDDGGGDGASAQATLSPLRVVYDVDEHVVAELLRVALCVGDAGQRLVDGIRNDAARGALHHGCATRTLPTVTRAALREYVYTTLPRDHATRHGRRGGRGVDDDRDNNSSDHMTRLALRLLPSWHVVCRLPRLLDVTATMSASATSPSSSAATVPRVTLNATHVELLLAHTQRGAAATRQLVKVDALLQRQLHKLARPSLLFVRHVHAMRQARTRADALAAAHAAWVTVMRGSDHATLDVAQAAMAATATRQHDRHTEEVARVWRAVLTHAEHESHVLQTTHAQSRVDICDRHTTRLQHGQSAWPTTVQELAQYMGVDATGDTATSDATSNGNGSSGNNTGTRAAPHANARAHTHSDDYATLLLQCMHASGHGDATQQMTTLWHVCAATLLSLQDAAWLQRGDAPRREQHAAQHALYDTYTTALLLLQQPQRPHSAGVMAARTRRGSYVDATVKALLLSDVFGRHARRSVVGSDTLWHEQRTLSVQSYDRYLHLQLALAAQLRQGKEDNDDNQMRALTQALTQRLAGNTTTAHTAVHDMTAQGDGAWQLYQPLLRSRAIATLWLRDTLTNPSDELLAWLSTHLDAHDTSSCKAYAAYTQALASMPRQRHNV